MNIELRKFDIGDVNSLSYYANNKKVSCFLRDDFPYPYTKENAKNFINYCIKEEDNQLVRAIAVNGEAVGSIGLFPKSGIYQKSAEVGYWLGEPFWNMGIVSDAVKFVCDFCFKNSDIIRIYAEIFACNIASGKVLEKCGFELEGWFKKSLFKDGNFYDSYFYALIKN